MGDLLGKNTYSTYLKHLVIITFPMDKNNFWKYIV